MDPMNQPYTYPLDREGLSTDNRIVDEPHTLEGIHPRAVVPHYGAFFAEGLVVKSTRDNTVLKEGEHYEYLHLYQRITESLGKAVYSVILITDETIGDGVTLTYQVLGGPFCFSGKILREMMEDVDLDEKPARFFELIGRPDQYAPEGHRHDADDLYGLEDVVRSMNWIAYALKTGRESPHDAIYQWMERLKKETNDAIVSLSGDSRSHTENRGDPHYVTKSHLLLGNVRNYPTADEELASERSSNDTYLTPRGARGGMGVHLSDGEHDHRYFLRNDQNKRHLTLVDDDDICLKGPLSVSAGSTVHYHITDYDGFSAYAAWSTDLGVKLVTDLNTPSEKADTLEVSVPAGTALGDKTFTVRRNQFERTLTISVV